jgi:hypothetical protein
MKVDRREEGGGCNNNYFEPRRQRSSGKCNNQPISTSIRLVIETMGGGEGGNVTINRVEGGHGRWKTQQLLGSTSERVR